MSMETHEDRSNDPAWQAVDEAGGGEQDGFEQAEDMLIEEAENAEHTIALDGFPEEAEDYPDRQSYGAADEEVKSSEVIAEEGVPPKGDTDS
jgi:hypothetical protein